MQYCSLQLWTVPPSPVTSTTGHCFHFGSISSFFLELFLHSSPVAYLALTNLGRSSSGVISLAFLYCSWGSQGKNTEVVCHFLHQGTTFCQNSPPWSVPLEWPYMTWLIVSLSLTRLWSMWSAWLIFCDCGFHSVCLLMVLVWLDWLVFCDYGFSVSALSQHLPSYLGFSYLGHGVSLQWDKMKLSETKPCSVGPPKMGGNGGEVWQNVAHWRREWQTTSVFLPWEPHEQYEKAKW